MLAHTLVYVAAKKRIERQYMEHVARELAALVRDRFDNNQTRTAKALGISQPHLSHLIAAEGRGPGLSVLIRLREYTGRSIDALLGLPPLPSDELTERLRAALDTEVARIKRDARMMVEEAHAKTQALAPKRSRKRGTGS